jgi:hypothetical protein
MLQQQPPTRHEMRRCIADDHADRIEAIVSRGQCCQRFMPQVAHGKMRVFVPNDYYRDGAPYESTGGYNSMHVTALGPIVDAVEHMREMRPETYPDEKYPSLSNSRRYRNVFDFCMDTMLIAVRTSTSSSSAAQLWGFGWV